nr:MAG TPA: hypothetical protein [Caudoviricetes sp.]
MSWLFSQALVAGYLVENYLGGEPCAQLNVMPMQHPFWHRDKTMESWSHSQFGLTCVVFPVIRGGELLTLFRGDFHAKTSHLQTEMQKEFLERGQGFGRKCSESFARLDPDTCSWKTPQLSLVEGLDVYSETWPRSGSMQNGMCLVRTTSAPHIKETGYGYLPTPDASMATRGPSKEWNPNSKSQKDRNLNTFVKFFPTPLASDYKRSDCPSERIRKSPCLASRVGGKPNPTWVEWLMGWPLGWTDCEQLATVRFLLWQQSHSQYLRKEYAHESVKQNVTGGIQA